MGIGKAEKPMRPKECVRPALIIESSTDSLSMRAPAQDTPKTPAYPLIHGRKGPLVTVLEILKPAAKALIDICDNGLQAVAIPAWRLGSKDLLDLAQALLAGPTPIPLEVISQKIKSFSGNRDVYQTGLFRMEAKSAPPDQLAQKVQSPLGFPFAATQDDQIVGVADHLQACPGHRHIYRVQVEIRKQGTNDSSHTIDNLAHSSAPMGLGVPLDRGRRRWSGLNVLLSPCLH